MKNSSCKGWHYCKAEFTIEESSQASEILIQTVQQEVYGQKINCIQKHEMIPKSSPLKDLHPFIDRHDLLRVGGCLHHSILDQSKKTPLIIPGKQHIAALLIRQYHKQIHHQGCLFTEGAVHSAGFWIVGMKRNESSKASSTSAWLADGLELHIASKKWPAFQQITFQQTLHLQMLG